MTRPLYSDRNLGYVSTLSHEMTRRPHSVDQFGWLHTFLKIYIRAFQQASDLDDTVEEKLLVGDRPKQTNDPGRPLNERLAQRNANEEQNVRPNRQGFRLG